MMVPPHPLIKHWLAVARNKETPPPVFRNCIAELGRLLVYEAARDGFLPVVEGEIESPLGVAAAEMVDPSRPVSVVPILRAGLVPLESALTLLPAQRTFHLGYVRNEETMLPELYLNKLPEKFAPEDPVLVCDPMLATGGTMMAALEELLARGASPNMIKVISIVAAPPALTKLGEKFPGAATQTPPLPRPPSTPSPPPPPPPPPPSLAAAPPGLLTGRDDGRLMCVGVRACRAPRVLRHDRRGAERRRIHRPGPRGRGRPGLWHALKRRECLPQRR